MSEISVPDSNQSVKRRDLYYVGPARGLLPYLGTRLATDLLSEIAQLQQRIAAIEAKLVDLPDLPAECRQHTCSYYRHYLAYGPADLTHEGYHAAERHCDEWQQRVEEWYDKHSSGKCPFEHIATQWERRVRA